MGNFTQEEMRLALVKNNISGNNNKGPKGGQEEENIALALKGKAKKGPSQGQGSQGGEKKDMSKTKCFGCGEFGHYSTQCLKRKKVRQ